MKLKALILTCLFLTQLTYSYGQNRISIYELGDSIINCETNFKNLFNNWTPENITNSDSYQLHKYSFVETITDSIRFNYYRNYFSGIEPIYSSVRCEKKENADGQRFCKFYIKPGFIHKEIFDQRGLPEKIREIFSEEFKSKARNILTRDINIDTTNLNYYFYEKNTIDTIITLHPHFNVHSVRKGFINHKVASPDSISKNYIDIFIKGEKNIESLKTDEKRPLILEQLLIERINKQLLFNKQVQIGDKVYLVDFEYNRKGFKNYVICSAENKNVVFDYFFKSVNLESENK